MFGSRPANLAVWVVLAALVVAWQAWCVAYRPRLPTLGDVAAAIRRRRSGRVLLALAWLWLGWHVFVRGAW